MKNKNGNKNKYCLTEVNAAYYLVVAMALGIAISYIYTTSGVIVYGAVMGVITIATYYLFLRYIRIDTDITMIVFFLTVISVIHGIIRGELFDALRVNLSIIMPIALCAISIRDTEKKKPWIMAFAVSMALIILLIQSEGTTSNTDEWSFNANSIAFLGFMALSPGFIWLKLSPKKIVPSVALIAGFIILTATKCRNLIFVFPLCMVLALLPTGIWKNKWFFRAVVIFALLYTVFAYRILHWLFFSSNYGRSITDFTKSVIEEKHGSMLLRVSFFERVLTKFRSIPLMEQLFGRGVRGSTHTHNMCYQSLFIYGYIGTALIYAVFFRIFEMARRLIKENGDLISLGCVIILIGHILINGADLYLLGTDCVAIVPQVFMAIIISRYTAEKRRKEGLYETQYHRSDL